MPYTFLNNAAAETLLGHSLEFMAREIGKTPECGSVRAVILDGGLRTRRRGSDSGRRTLQ